VRRKIVLGSLVICSLFFVGLLGIQTVSAQDDAVASQYAPVLYFDGGETCFPVNVSYYVSHAQVYRNTGTGSVLVDAAPTLESLANYTDSSYYLDNVLGGVSDNGIIEAYQAARSSLGYTVYAHVLQSGQQTIIQYWYFYVFNPGDLNRHEGDWEMAQVVVEAGSPVQVMYSQHNQGQRAPWSLVEHDGTHMKDYIARGSHASYLRSYSGKLGIASDSVGANGLVLQPKDYAIVMLGNQSWLSFGGSWGWAGGNQTASVQAALLGEAGPQGPKFREGSLMWQNPVSWGAGLLQAQQPLFMAEWFVYNFMAFLVLFTIIAVLLLAVVIVRRYRRTGLGPKYFSMLYIDGFNVHSIGNILCIVGLVLTVVAVFLPWYTVSGRFSFLGQNIVLDRLLTIDAFNGLQANFPSSQGPVALGSLVMPIAYIVLIGTVLLVIGTVGISRSKKLGLRYIGRGVRLLVPLILILVFVLVLGQLAGLVPATVPEAKGPATATLNAISKAPFQGTLDTTISDIPGSAMTVSWQLGWGVYLLVFAAIVFFIAGLLEIASKKTFYEEHAHLGRLRPPVVEESSGEKPKL
jgi:hypothetical protein